MQFLFFISTGFFIGKGQTKGKTDILKLRLIKYIKLYLFWSAIYLPLALVQYINNEHGIIFNILLYIRGLLFVGEQYNSWILWYLLSTIYALLVLYLLDKFKCDKRKTLICCIIIGLVLGTGLDILSGLDSELPALLLLLQKWMKYTIANGRIFRGLLYIPIGMLMSKNELSFIRSALLFVIGWLLIFFAPIIALNVWVAICSIGLFGLILNIRPANKWYYSLLRTISTVMYFMHLWIWTIYYAILYQEKRFGFDSFLISVVITILLGIAYYIYMKKSVINN